ncbi:MAG: hypothetical protein IJL30_05330, partial [Clostridia bacterium]|nr:hypothetical protein [Clostridia bacterium]
RRIIRSCTVCALIAALTYIVRPKGDDFGIRRIKIVISILADAVTAAQKIYPPRSSCPTARI